MEEKIRENGGQKLDYFKLCSAAKRVNYKMLQTKSNVSVRSDLSTASRDSHSRSKRIRVPWNNPNARVPASRQPSGMDHGIKKTIVV